MSFRFLGFEKLSSSQYTSFKFHFINLFSPLIFLYNIRQIFFEYSPLSNSFFTECLRVYSVHNADLGVLSQFIYHVQRLWHGIVLLPLITISVVCWFILYVFSVYFIMSSGRESLWSRFICNFTVAVFPYFWILNVCYLQSSTIISVANTLLLDFTLFVVLCIISIAVVGILFHATLAKVVISLGWNPQRNY